MNPCETEICEQLLFMCIIEFFNTLEFNNYFVFNDQVGSEAFIKFESTIFYRDSNLLFNLKSLLS